MKFRFWLHCPEMTGPVVDYINDQAQQITYDTFAHRADLRALRAGGHPAMYRISAPDNWSVSFYKSELPSGLPVYFFDWSAMEYVFVPPRSQPSLHQEHSLVEAGRYAVVDCPEWLLPHVDEHSERAGYFG